MSFIFGTRGSTGIFASGVQADCQKTALKTFFVVVLFSPQLILQFYRGFPMVISKKTIISKGLRGGTTFSRGVNFFQGVPNTNFYRNPCKF